MFVGQTVMCLVEVLICVHTSGINGTKKCVPEPVQRPAMCKVVDMFSLDYGVAEVNCAEYLFKTKRYDVAKVEGNKRNQEVNQDLCDEHTVID